MTSDQLAGEDDAGSPGDGRLPATSRLQPVLGRPSSAWDQEPRAGARTDASSAGYRAAGGSTDWCTLRAATVTGVRHRLAGEPSQDSFAWAVGEERVALAVTDGLGSVDASELAASAAASAAVAAAAADDGDEPELTAVHAANSACAGGGATTLVVAVVERSGRVDLVRVGDSTAFVVEPDGAEWRELFEPAGTDEGTVNVTTAALPAEEPAVERASVDLSAGQALILASDGIGDPWRDGPTTVAPAFASAVGARPSPLELAALADFSRQGCHDDRTIVLVWL